ncbi:hemolysin family protein [Caenispirillum bisanense]|uniref:CBS domain-containing protein n=1 Tax=Caenispirillum bisanense TaxID=414052 RepID=A0A286GUF7_9PROT|nr:hemolysin family protein [Caenispirillum bisanense]SOD99203.1 CBS domain-containing protein [Caenispirillum bisanense]
MNDQSSSSQPRVYGAEHDNGLLTGVRHWLKGLRRRNGGDHSVRETLEELIEEREQDELPIDEHEQVLLTNIFRLRDLTAYDVMIPRADIVAVEVEMALREVTDILARVGHSRLPVYRETLDDVIGMVHIKDLVSVVAKGRTVNLQHLVRRVLFVSPSIRVLDLLLEMRLKRTHMALVVDEYGGIDGLLTIEDVVEQIVGEIEDEHDTETDPEMVEMGDGTAVADARVSLEDFEERYGEIVSEDEREEIDTLGGLVFRITGRIPARGELVRHPESGLEFEIVEADPRRIRRLRVRNLPPPIERAERPED